MPSYCRKTKEKPSISSPISGFASAFQACFGTFFIGLLCRYTVVYTALHGNRVGNPVRLTLQLFAKSEFNAVIVDVITKYLLLAGQLLAAFGISIATLAISNGRDDRIGVLSFVLIFLATLAVFLFFSSLIQIGVDTILVCYMEMNEVRNVWAPKNISPDLRKLLLKHMEP
jgi:hypothetical protein